MASGLGGSSQQWGGGIPFPASPKRHRGSAEGLWGPTGAEEPGMEMISPGSCSAMFLNEEFLDLTSDGGGLKQNNSEISSKSSVEHKQQQTSQNLIYFLGGTF